MEEVEVSRNHNSEDIRFADCIGIQSQIDVGAIYQPLRYSELITEALLDICKAFLNGQQKIRWRRR